MKVFTSKILVVLFCIGLFSVGCEPILEGIGIGVAATEALDSWEDNLEAKGIELTQEYEKAILRMQNVADSNELAFEIEKAQQIQIARIANATALATIRESKSEKSTSAKGGYLNLLYGLIPLLGGYAGIELKKRIASEKKRQADKQGRELALREIAAMKDSDVTAPVVKELMYKAIGDARRG